MVTDFWQGYSFVGLSTDTLPDGCPNGSRYYCIDTGDTYLYDAENDKWYDQNGNVV